MRALALFALTGCTQFFGLAEPTRARGDAGGDAIDAVATDMQVLDDAPGDALSRRCSAAEAGLIACFDFEGSVTDQSSIASAVTTSNITFDEGVVGMAVRLDATSMITLAPQSAYDVTSVTVQAWVFIEALPASTQRAGVFDSNGRYSLFIHSDGSFNSRFTSSGPNAIAVGEWAHIAVTDDGATRQFVKNGVVLASFASSAVPMTSEGAEIGGNAPTGDRLTGRIDQLRVYGLVRSAQQLAVDATP